MFDNDYINKLIEIITPVRLSAYGNGVNKALLEKYIYNIIISEAFYPALSLLEITLRNKICSAVEKYTAENWLLNEIKKQRILDNKEYQKLIEAAEKIRKSGREITNDKLISEMTLGFWVHLCKKSYKTKLWDKKGFFEAVFPNYKQKGSLRNISHIQQDLAEILHLRNRIFHHENILNGKKPPEEQYQLILNIIRMLSGEIEVLPNSISRFEIIKNKSPGGSALQDNFII